MSSAEPERAGAITEPTSTDRVAIDAGEVTVAIWGNGTPEIVMVHDGLGSIDQWRTIPGQIASRTGRSVMAYDRPGHGTSTPAPTWAWPSDWLHTEAFRLGRLLTMLGVDQPLLVGHSDGGSIVLLLAAAQGGCWGLSPSRHHGPGPAFPGLKPRGVLTLAAHTWVEDNASGPIAEMRADPAPIVAGLARNHAEPAKVFEAWSGVWVSDAFRPWDIRPMLSAIEPPTLITQGKDDEYATDAQATDTAAAVGENAECRLLDGVGHLLHHQDPELVNDTVVEFDRSLG